MRILTASDRALLVEAADLDEAMRLHRAWERMPGVVELVPGARTVLVRFDPLQTSAADLARRLQETRADAVDAPPAGVVEIPVHYDGEDLDEVARLLGVSASDLVARHLAADWRVAFSGFAPGFGYLVGDDPLFDVPRRASPRTRVPAGAVGLAGAFTGVYPRESPGGWQLIGRTDAVMWDVDRDPPALLAPGARVRFVTAGSSPVAPSPVERGSVSDRDETPHGAHDQESYGSSLRFVSLRSLNGREGESPSAVERGSVSDRDETPHGAHDPAIEVLSPGMQLLVQDLGRPGHAALGVSASGAADRTALHDANRAVGNDRGDAALEAMGAAALRFQGAAVMAVTGAVGALTLTDAAGDEHPAPHGAPFAVADGEELRLGFPEQGMRYVIAVRGGIRVPPVLGSRSTDTLAGLGPAPLSAGDLVAIGGHAPHLVQPDPVPRPLPASGDLVELEITLGPRDDWFTADAVRTLLTQEWEVTSRADRIGIRLRGEAPLEREMPGELPSEGAVTGAIQVPPDGQPVLFLADHPLTGGYPIIGAVTDRLLDLAGQLPPGCRIRFVTA